MLMKINSDLEQRVRVLSKNTELLDQLIIDKERLTYELSEKEDQLSQKKKEILLLNGKIELLTNNDIFN